MLSNSDLVGDRLKSVVSEISSTKPMVEQKLELKFVAEGPITQKIQEVQERPVKGILASIRAQFDKIRGDKAKKEYREYVESSHQGDPDSLAHQADVAGLRADAEIMGQLGDIKFAVNTGYEKTGTVRNLTPDEQAKVDQAKVVANRIAAEGVSHPVIDYKNAKTGVKSDTEIGRGGGTEKPEWHNTTAALLVSLDENDPSKVLGINAIEDYVPPVVAKGDYTMRQVMLPEGVDYRSAKYLRVPKVAGFAYYEAVSNPVTINQADGSRRANSGKFQEVEDKDRMYFRVLGQDEVRGLGLGVLGRNDMERRGVVDVTKYTRSDN